MVHTDVRGDSFTHSVLSHDKLNAIIPIPFNNPCNNPLCNPPYNPPSGSLDYNRNCLSTKAGDVVSAGGVNSMLSTLDLGQTCHASHAGVKGGTLNGDPCG